MSAKECLEHPWLAQCAERMSRVALPTDKLKKFIVRRKWQVRITNKKIIKDFFAVDLRLI